MTRNEERKRMLEGFLTYDERGLKEVGEVRGVSNATQDF
jgi:hypothetical protein